MSRLAAAQLSKKYKLLVATAISFLLSLAIAVLCFVVAPNWQAGAVSLLLGIVGLLIGWIVGVALTPYSPEEKYQFSTYTKAIGVFATGYVAAKIDRIFEYLASPDNIFVSNTQTGLRLLIFIASAFLALITVFTHRQYIQRDEFERVRREYPTGARASLELTAHDVEIKADRSDRSASPP